MNELYEMRCEYPVSVNRKRLWERELIILSDIDQVCRDNNLQYFLIGGAGIGAIRHQGFIPWDDDIDIGMSRKDFELFLICFKDRFQKDYCIQYGCGDYEECGTFLRIRDRQSTAILKSQWHNRNQCHGSFVEVYPFDTVVEDVRLKDRQIKKIKIYEKVLNHRFADIHYTGLKGLLDHIFSIIVPTKKVWQLWDKECQRYNNTESEWLDTLAVPVYAKKGIHVYKKSQVFPTVYVRFEDYMFSVPADNDACLRIHFGDYMKLPPVEQRGMNHNRIVYFDPNKSYCEYLGTDIPDRYFSGEIDDLL